MVAVVGMEHAVQARRLAGKSNCPYLRNTNAAGRSARGGGLNRVQEFCLLPLQNSLS